MARILDLPSLLVVLFMGAALGRTMPLQAEVPSGDTRTRVIVLTDISSLTSGVAEPDDGQSLIRLMLYANELDIEGLVASSNLIHGQRTRPELIRQVVDAYEKVHPSLLRHDDRYPPGDQLRSVIKEGQPRAGLDVPVERSVGENLDTDASEWIIQVVDRPDPRPVWVIVWGGSADLAQALDKVRRTRPRAELGRFLSRVRVHAIGDQDSTGPWIREQFPDLFTITQRRAYRGMYRGGDVRLTSSDWVRENIHGHGALGDLYPDYRGGDIWTGSLGPVRGIKEGDTPSFLALLPNGLFDPERLGLGSWGGRFEGSGGKLVDVADTDLGDPSDPDPRVSSVYRWRRAFQNDFEARLDWCLTPYAGANHPPMVRVRGGLDRTLTVGSDLVLDAESSSDPDGNELDFSWTIYPGNAELARGVRIDGETSPRPRIALSPDLAPGLTIPVLLTVSDRGRPALSRYARVLIRVEGRE